MKVILFGNGKISEVAYNYLKIDSSYQVTAICINNEYFNENSNTFDNIPLVGFDEVQDKYPPSEYYFFIPFSGTNMNKLREKIYNEAKQKGYADRQIAHLLNCLESEVNKKREELGINRVFKLVDTCAAEFEAKTPYYYSTFEDENESIRTDKKKVVILGSGPNRIGQGIEFDYSCVHGVLAAKECGYETIMINCNPETVSTDFSTADKLYFEPVFWEHIYDIIKHEKPEGVIVQLGGQTALKLAEKLERYGIKIIGTDYKSLDLAEDRGSFSSLLKANEIPYPKLDRKSTRLNSSHTDISRMPSSA